MQCPNCHAAIDDDSTFCEQCGAKITKQKTTSAKMPLIIGGIVAAVIVIAAIVGVTILMADHGPKSDSPAVAGANIPASENGKQGAEISVLRVDHSGFPSVLVYLQANTKSGNVSSLSASDFEVSETDYQGTQYPGTLTSVTKLTDTKARAIGCPDASVPTFELAYVTGYDKLDMNHDINITFAKDSKYNGSVTKQYAPVSGNGGNMSFKNSGGGGLGSLSSSAYMIPDSNSRYLTKAELGRFSLWELYIGRNEIYARHGRGFDNKDLQDYFNKKSWYKRTTDPKDFKESVLNQYEKSNVQLIKSIEVAANSPYVK